MSHGREAAGDRSERSRTRPIVLLLMVLVIATAGLVYELVIAAVASYVLGDSITQFSIVIGVYLSALGLGAYLSRFVERRLAETFVNVELAAALLGGFSAPGLFLAYAFTNAFAFILYASCLGVGVLVGLELPLLIRVLEQRLAFKELIARALTFDYAGALLGSLAFSLVLVPRLGLVRSSIACGALNALVGLASTFALEPAAGGGAGLRGARWRALFVLLMLAIGWFEAERVLELSESTIFGGQTLLHEQSRYQRIVVTEREGALELHLNGNLQFSSADERRYHEALVHPVMGASERRRKVLIAGGGDGLALREVFAWPEVREVTLVDLDAKMTDLFRTQPALTRLNHDALRDPRLRLVNADAAVWLRDTAERFDVMIFDFPDPSNYSLGKLYSQNFYRAARGALAKGGAVVVQATSPLFARPAYWCIVKTLEAAGFAVLPYHVFVPSFGEWGYALAKLERFDPPTLLPSAPLSYLDSRTLAALFEFPEDMQRLDTAINRLDNQALVAYYVADWSRWN